MLAFKVTFLVPLKTRMKGFFDKYVFKQEALKKSPDKPKEDDNKPYPIVIGAGFGRTGTTSIKVGLNELGYRCYHMTEALANENKMHAELWYFLYQEKMKLKKEKNVTSFDKWDQITLPHDKYGKYFETLLDDAHYTATCDWPTCMFYLEIMEYYKQKGTEFKVLLSIRDSGEKWWKSYSETIGATPRIFSHWLWRGIPSMKYQFKLMTIVFKLPFGKETLDKDHIVKKYYEWIEAVTKLVDEDRLIIYNVKQGWIPLCKALKLEIPEKYADKPDEFIRANDSKEMKKRISCAGKMIKAADIIAVIIILFIVYYVINMLI